MMGMTRGDVAELNAILFSDPFDPDAVARAIQAREDAEADEQAAEAEAEARLEGGWLF